MFRTASFALLAAAALSGCHPPHGAGKFHPNVLAVQGTGEFEAKPDVARITLGVESQDANAATAVQTTNAKIAAVIAAIKQSGVADKDIQTAQLSIYSEQITPPYPPVPVAPPPQAAPVGKAAPASAPAAAIAPAAPPQPQIFYRATNTLVIAVRRIETAGVVIGAALAAGANQAGGIQFDVENHQPLEDQARAKAVADAVHRAAELGRLSGVKVGKVLSVSEGPEQEGPHPMYSAKVASFRADSGGAVPVEGGQIKVTHVVRVVFAIDRDD